MARTMLVVPLVQAVLATAHAGRLAVPVQADGNYSVVVDGAEVFNSGDTVFRDAGAEFSARKGTLSLVSASDTSGTDSPGGAFTGKNMTWRLGSGKTVATVIRVYASHAVFEQVFPEPLNNTSTGDRNDVVSTFPSFAEPANRTLGVLSFKGDMTASSTSAGTWGGGVDDLAAGAGPVATCRLSGSAPFKLTESGAGFDAYTPADGSTPRNYQAHTNMYCGEGNSTHAPTVFQGKLDVDACRAKCDEMTCECFDFQSHSGGGGGGGSAIGSGISGSGPVVFFERGLKMSLVVSAGSNFMAHSQKSTPAGLEYGLMGAVETVPSGYVLATVLVLSPNGGVNAAMDAWGDVLLAASGKARYAYKRDFANQFLGYSTDNGAYYYYQTEPGTNYEDTLIDVKKYADAHQIPYKYVLLDSWWYYKGKGGGVAEWDARPDVFPNGLEYLMQQTGWPTQLHNRMWAPDSNYSSKNGGAYNFIDDGSSVILPDDQLFWDDLIKNKSKTGMFMYEQDWLDREFDDMKALGSSATLGGKWMQQMNDGCEKSNVTIQMCMSHVRHILKSLEMPAVTNARASGDYHPGNGQWYTGKSSMLAHAVGIAPSKDNYWSTSVENGTHYGPTTTEPRTRLQAATISFTTGPVAPSDAVGFSNASLILMSCDASGRLLTPDRPLTDLDSKVQAEAFGGDASPGGHVMSASTSLRTAGADVAVVKYVLGVNLKGGWSVSMAELFSGDAPATVAAVEQGTSCAKLLARDDMLEVPSCGDQDFKVYTVSPVLSGGFALLGEPLKWASVSNQRFSNLVSALGSGSASVTLSGAPNEMVTVSWMNAKTAQCVSGTCKLSSTGTAVMAVNATGATCS